MIRKLMCVLVGGALATGLALSSTGVALADTPATFRAAPTLDLLTDCPSLARGESDECVRVLQSWLNGAGANLQEDGIFGPITEGVVEAFQSTQGLTPDGVAGPLTKKALLDAGSVATPQPTATQKAPPVADSDDPAADAVTDGVCTAIGTIPFVGVVLGVTCGEVLTPSPAG